MIYIVFTHAHMYMYTGQGQGSNRRVGCAHRQVGWRAHPADDCPRHGQHYQRRLRRRCNLLCHHCRLDLWRTLPPLPPPLCMQIYIWMCLYIHGKCICLHKLTVWEMCTRKHTHTYGCGQNRWLDWQPCSRRRSKRARPPTRPRARLRLKSLSIYAQFSLSLSLSLSRKLGLESQSSPSSPSPPASRQTLPLFLAAHLPRNKMPHVSIDWFWLWDWQINKGAICTRTASLFPNFISLFHPGPTNKISSDNRQSKSVYHTRLRRGQECGALRVAVAAARHVSKVPCLQDAEEGMTIMEAIFIPCRV